MNDYIPDLDFIAVDEEACLIEWYFIFFTDINSFFSTQRPLELGADMVLHSLTKYMNGEVM